MGGNILQNLGELGTSIERLMDRKIENARRELYDLGLLPDAEDERYELSAQQLADLMSCGKDKIFEYVHKGVLRGCFVKHGNAFKFKARASRRAIELNSEREVYGEEGNEPKALIDVAASQGDNVREMPTRKSA